MIDPATGVPQLVMSADGHEGWQVIADPAPADYHPDLYAVVDGALVPDLARARVAQRAIINAARDAAQDAGADTPSGRMNSDQRARQFINGAVSSAQIALAAGQPFLIDWTLANNSDVTLDAEAMITAGLAVAAHVNAMHQRARVLKARIDAAETLADICAVQWTLED